MLLHKKKTKTINKPTAKYFIENISFFFSMSHNIAHIIITAKKNLLPYNVTTGKKPSVKMSQTYL